MIDTSSLPYLSSSLSITSLQMIQNFSPNVQAKCKTFKKVWRWWERWVLWKCSIVVFPTNASETVSAKSTLLRGHRRQWWGERGHHDENDKGDETEHIMMIHFTFWDCHRKLVWHYICIIFVSFHFQRWTIWWRGKYQWSRRQWGWKRRHWWL